MNRLRRAFGLIHRWGGLTLAVFLIITGLTGAVISWDHELDEWLNPHLTSATAVEPGTYDTLALQRAVEARHPEVEVTFFELAVEPGHSIAFWVDPRIDPSTGKPYDVAYNQVFVDPGTGEELGTREWGAVWPLSTETFVSFLYKLHYTLHIPAMWGTDLWGVWLLGVVALLWTLDCFVGFYLTLPARRKAALPADGALAVDEERGLEGEPLKKTWLQRWKPSWLVRLRSGNYKLNFDLHRAGGLWTWGLLFVIAFTGFSMNLESVFRPALALVSDVTPSVWSERDAAPLNQPIAPGLSFAEAIGRAQSVAEQRGWEAPPGYVYYSHEYGVFGVAFFHPDEGHGAGGVGHHELHLDGTTGAIVGDLLPWSGTVADIFLQAQFPLHSGRILGLPGRILISLMGLVVAGLSVTGVYIWWRKRIARLRAASRRSGRINEALPVGAPLEVHMNRRSMS